MAGDTPLVLASQTLTVPLADVALIQHRTELIAHKLPSLNSMPMLAANQEQIAQTLGLLLVEQQAAWQNLVDRHNVTT
jgi:hypothetical protein